jgi:hypothetical protein
VFDSMNTTSQEMFLTAQRTERRERVERGTLRARAAL